MQVIVLIQLHLSIKKNDVNQILRCCITYNFIYTLKCFVNEQFIKNGKMYHKSYTQDEIFDISQGICDVLFCTVFDLTTL